MHISFFSLTLLGSALLSLGCMVQGSTLGKASVKRSRGDEETPSAKRTIQPAPEVQTLSSWDFDSVSAEAIKEVQKTLKAITEDLDSYDLGAVERLLQLEEGYELVCRTVIGAFFDHTIGETNHTYRVKDIYNSFKDAVAQGNFADSRGFLTKVLKSLEPAVEFLGEQADILRTTGGANTVEALEALSKNEQARNEMIEIFAQIMMDRGNFRPIEQLETSEAIVKRVVQALAALKHKSIEETIMSWISELTSMLCVNDQSARGSALVQYLYYRNPLPQD